jgi:hypothetical protein
MRIRTTLAALALATSSMLAPPPAAHAVETDACHRATDLTQPIPVAQYDGGLVGYIFWNECTRAKYGWGDAQRLYVPENRNVRSWIRYNNGPWHLRGTWQATGWHRTSDYCGQYCWLSITYD